MKCYNLYVKPLEYTTKPGDKMGHTRRFPIVIIVTIFIAAALRLYGFRWGLPNSLHSYSYHPDEFLIIGSVLAVLKSLLPGFYNYPSLYIYLVSLSTSVGAGYGLISTAAGFYLCARIITVILGVAAVAAVYRAGRTLFSSTIGLAAAFILCIVPIHVQHSHFATVDVPSTLFISLALSFAGMVLVRGLWKDYLWCGIMAGLAAGTKYNAGLVVLSLIAAHILQNGTIKQRWLKLISALGCMIAAFLISTPGVILQTSNFLSGLNYEIHHTSTGHGLVFAGTGNGFIYTFTSSLWYGLGPGLAILFAAAVIYGLIKRDRSAIIVLMFVLPYYVLISHSQVRFARYTIPMLPGIAVLTAWMICDVYRKLRGLRWVWVGLIGAVLAGTLLYTLALDRLFTQPDPRDTAARWIFANVRKGMPIGTINIPWFYSPPYTKTIGLGTLPQRIAAMKAAPYHIRAFEESDYIYDTLPVCWVVSDYEMNDTIRLANNKSISKADRMQVNRNMRDITFIHRFFKITKTYNMRLSACGIDFGSTQNLPHDMRYQSPTIWIYGARK